MGFQVYLRVKKILKSTHCQSVKHASFETQWGGRPNEINPETTAFEQVSISGGAEPAQVGCIEDATVLILPLTTEQCSQNAVVANIGRTGTRQGAPFHEWAKTAKRRPRVHQVLQNFTHNQDVEMALGEIQFDGFNVSHDDLVHFFPGLLRGYLAKLNTAVPTTLASRQCISGRVTVAASNFQQASAGIVRKIIHERPPRSGEIVNRLS